MSRAPEEKARRELVATLRGAHSPWMHQAANEIEALSADLAALRIEHEAWRTIIDATRAARDEARDDVAVLRAQVAELQRLAASIHKAADAARKAERADVVAELRRLYAAQQSRETPVAAALDILVGLFESGSHEGAASPK